MNPQDPRYNGNATELQQPRYPTQSTANNEYDTSNSTMTSTAQNNGSQNPYDFILNSNATQKNSTLGGNSTLKRVLVVVGLLAVLTIVGIIVANLLIPKDNTIPQLTAIAQEQQELVRIADEVAVKTTDSELKNLAVTASMSIGTNQKAVLDYMSTRGASPSQEILALKLDAETDTLFAGALSSNTFDITAEQTLSEKVSTYQANLEKAYAATSGEKARAVLKASHDTAAALVAEVASIKD